MSDEQPSKTGERWFVAISFGVIATLAIVLAVSFFEYREYQRRRTEEIGRTQLEFSEQQLKASR